MKMLQQETCGAFSLNNLLSTTCRLVLRPLILAATYTGTSPHEVSQLIINCVCCRIQYRELYLVSSPVWIYEPLLPSCRSITLQDTLKRFFLQDIQCSFYIRGSKVLLTQTEQALTLMRATNARTNTHHPHRNSLLPLSGRTRIIWKTSAPWKAHTLGEKTG